MTQFAKSPESGLLLPVKYSCGRRVVGGRVKMGRGSGRHFDVRPHVKAALQEMLYQPCECGSGRKWKFCCWKKERAV
jgi:hypothetical protein